MAKEDYSQARISYISQLKVVLTEICRSMGIRKPHHMTISGKDENYWLDILIALDDPKRKMPHGVRQRKWYKILAQEAYVGKKLRVETMGSREV